MEVLSSTSSITLSPQVSESRLLARRSSRQNLPILDDVRSRSSSMPTHIFTPIPVAPASSSINFSQNSTSTTPDISPDSMPMVHGPVPVSPPFTPSTSLSSVTATAILRPPRRVKSGIVQGSSGVSTFLPFVPLTPIIGSPRLTPEPGTNSENVAVYDEDRQRRPGGDAGASGKQFSRHDNLDACAHIVHESQTASGMRLPAVDADAPPQVHRLPNPVASSNFVSDISSSFSLRRQRSVDRLITPSWTSTPPTPPHLLAAQRQLVANSDNGVGSLRHRTSRLGQPRPASLAVFPDAVRYSGHSSSSSPRKCPETDWYSLHLRPSNDAGAGAVTHGSDIPDSGKRIVQRRRSLPPDFWKPLPPTPSDSESSHTPSPIPHSPLGPKILSESHHRHPSPIPRSPQPSRSYERLMPGTETRNYHPCDDILSASFSRLPITLGRKGSSPLRRGVIASQSDPGEQVIGVLPTSDSAESYKTALSHPNSSPGLSSPRSSLRDSPSSKKLFHLDGDDDGEDDEDVKISGEDRVRRNDIGEESKTMRIDTATRSKQYHAVLELLTTELGYLMDLKTLTSVYLTQLENLSIPVPIPSPSRPSPSSLSISGLTRSFPSSRSYISTCAPTITNSGFGLGPPEDERGINRPSSPELGLKERAARAPLRRPVMSDSEFALVKRNVEELVTFHERFVSVLRSKVEPFGFGPVLEGKTALVASMEAVEGGVKAIAEAFVTEAASFEIYQGFCPKHKEAIDLVRRMQDSHPVEWDAFEQRCSLLVAHISDGSAELPSQYSSESVRKKRRHSTPALSTYDIHVAPNKSEPVQERPRQRTEGCPAQLGRLKFLDYLIKPVQRICKYPLLLDLFKLKIQPSGVAGTDVVESACAAMRNVCGLVDDASTKQMHAIKSALIVSRIVASQQDDKPSPLSSEFLNSLGACLMAGALDVVHHVSSSRSRYLGAFLYVGGYIVLVKIPKGGKVYEPKYWFPLAGFEVIDVKEDDAAFPYSFHLYGNGEHFQFAAACKHEKEIWLEGIHVAMTQPASWTNEPVSSLQATEKSPISMISGMEENYDYNTAGLPTIQSMGELEDHDAAAQIPRTYSRPFKTMARLEGSAMKNDQFNSGYVPLSRRSSTASVKAFFAPLTFETSRISRPSSQVRQQVDHGLRDVFSDSCIAVRSQFQMRDGELFQVRKKHNSAGMPRSNSGLSISTAMNFATKKRQDGTPVSHKRKHSVEKNTVDVTSDPDNPSKYGLKISKKPNSFSARRQYRQQILIIPPAPSTSNANSEAVSPEALAESPVLFSQTPSDMSSNVHSALPSPSCEVLPLPTPPNATQDTIRPVNSLQARRPEYRPKRTRSMVDNVRYFFHSRSVSPAQSHSGPNSPTIVVDSEMDSPGGLVQWWRRGSFRRRVQSSPDTPLEESYPMTGQSSEDSHSTSLNHSTAQSRSDMDQSPPSSATPDVPRRVMFTEVKPARRRSLFVSSLHKSSSQVEAGSRKSLKSIIFSRSHSFTKVDADDHPD